MTASLRRRRTRPHSAGPRHNHHITCARGHAVHLTSNATAGKCGNDRGTAGRHQPAVPASRRKGPVPGSALCGSLPTSQARDPRRASPGGQARPTRAGQEWPGLRASVRPPGHARPHTRQDTGQTTARRSRPHPSPRSANARTAENCHPRRKEKADKNKPVEDLERAGRAFPGRMEHRHPGLRIPG
jgi:hypothetical protein